MILGKDTSKKQCMHGGYHAYCTIAIADLSSMTAQVFEVNILGIYTSLTTILSSYLSNNNKFIFNVNVLWSNLWDSSADGTCN